MPKNDVKSISKRKPLGDISNGVKIASKSVKKPNSLIEDRTGDDALDALLLVHSHISTLLHQIDELVVQSLKLKVTSKKGSKEIESFANILSEMQSSLKPWVPRFQKVLSSPSTVSENQLEQPLASKTCYVDEDLRESNDSPNESKIESLVSPSPLVCWRAESTTENGRQLFMLTPLPRPKLVSSKALESSKLVFERITSDTAGGPPSHYASTKNMNDDLVEDALVNLTQRKNCESIATKLESTLSLDSRCVSPSPFKKNSSMFALTPCLKMSPPKSCVLLEPASEVFDKYNHGFRKSTPFPVGAYQNSSWFEDSESSSGSEVECTKKTIVVEPSQKLGNGKKASDKEWSNWSMSPPKTCILMEPSDEKLLEDAAAATVCQLPTGSRVDKKENSLHKKSCNQGFTEIESTPMWKETESGMKGGRRPGENTLKKELWTKFEAATAMGTHLNVPVQQPTAIKGFLDRLEEASCDEASPLNEDPR